MSVWCGTSTIADLARFTKIAKPKARQTVKLCLAYVVLARCKKLHCEGTVKAQADACQMQETAL